MTANTPPTFLVQTEDDGVRVENSVAYYLALKNAKVPVEMHLYAAGGHGYGLRPTDRTVTSWPQRAAEWLRVYHEPIVLSRLLPLDYALTSPGSPRQ